MAKPQRKDEILKSELPPSLPLMALRSTIVYPLGTIAVQMGVFRALKGVSAIDLAPVRRKRRLIDMIDLTPVRTVRSHRDWETAVTPLAVAGTLVAMALFSAVVVNIAARPEAWGAITRDPTPTDTRVNAFRN